MNQDSSHVFYELRDALVPWHQEGLEVFVEVCRTYLLLRLQTFIAIGVVLTVDALVYVAVVLYLWAQQYFSTSFLRVLGRFEYFFDRLRFRLIIVYIGWYLLIFFYL